MGCSYTTPWFSSLDMSLHLVFVQNWTLSRNQSPRPPHLLRFSSPQLVWHLRPPFRASNLDSSLNISLIFYIWTNNLISFKIYPESCHSHISTATFQQRHLLLGNYSRLPAGLAALLCPHWSVLTQQPEVPLKLRSHHLPPLRKTVWWRSGGLRGQLEVPAAV